ncbi:hypothetical protein N2152v2_007893 [Parachlorella kessleri]
MSLAPLDVGILPALADPVVVSNDAPVLDLAKVVPSGRLEQLQQELKQLERDTGYRVRLLTRYGPSDEPSVEQLRRGWNIDEKTVVVFVDPTASSIISFPHYGMDVQKVLRRPFFTELQARFGNLFYVREMGESAAVVNAMDTLVASLEHPEDCLAQGGCRQVPGVSSDMYFFTLATAIAGGLVVGFVDKLEPQGWVQRKWVWQLLFAPLSVTLFINFGLGPIVTRTSDPLPVLGNVLGFTAAAALVKFSPVVARATGLMQSGYDNK